MIINNVFPAHQVIVVGGGLAGFSAAHTILEHGGRVVILDKSAICGGNSCKATSGINGCRTRTQSKFVINDDIDSFVEDTLTGGSRKQDMAEALCGGSAEGLHWLMDKFGVDLSLVTRLGGHSQPRTHRGNNRFPGRTITYALMERYEKLCLMNTGRARLINKARVFRLITVGSSVIGCEYVNEDGVCKCEYGPVIMATGGYGFDDSADSLLAEYRPDLLHFPTTNGEHCTGDGIKMAMTIGAKTVDLDCVQVHPTGLVKPADAAARTKFLGAEALRGVGGILVDNNGNRFCNELGRRDYVTGEMWKNKPPFRLILNASACKEISWHIEHYCGIGVMKKFQNSEELANEMGINVSVLEQTFEKYNFVAEKMKIDPNNGPYDAYPKGKSWDKFGKCFFPNVPISAVEELHVAVVTPVVHYCMGGIEITPKGECLSNKGGLVGGLFAAGEVTGGIHGSNRLGGNSLLECVVFGRAAGQSCAKYIFGDDDHFRLFPKDVLE